MNINQTYLWAKGFLPKFLIKRWKNLISYADLEVNADVFSGFMLINSILIGLSTAVVLTALGYGTIYSIVAFFFSSFLFAVLLDTIVRIVADSRAKICESAFPDVLILMSSNIMAGLTPEKALQYSIREEFGPLTKELQYASRKASTGLDFGKVLLEVPRRIKSTLIESRE
jgi:Flp pilus assembly protein TadB